MDIGAIQGTSLIDYPGKVCAVFFTLGCNFRCGFCYSPELVFSRLKKLPGKNIEDFLKERQKFLDAIILSGGEPLLQKDIVGFCKKLKKYGYLVGIETNGSKPGTLKKLIDNKLVNFIAMDIKSDLEHYSKITGVDVNTSDIKKSIELIKNSGVDLEFRTTVVPGFYDKEIAENIGKILKGANKYVLQQFNNSKEMIDSSFKNKKPYKEAEIKKFRKILEKYIDNVGLRF